MQRKQAASNGHAGQVHYLDRWVDKAHFRTFVYDKDGKQKLAESFEQYEALTSSGLYFATKPDVSKKQGKAKYDASGATS